MSELVLHPLEDKVLQLESNTVGLSLAIAFDLDVPSWIGTDESLRKDFTLRALLRAGPNDLLKAMSNENVDLLTWLYIYAKIYSTPLL